MINAARICTAIAATCTGLLAAYGPQLPLWARIALCAGGLLTGGLVAASPPVQGK
jgi:hypothetical protein